MLYIWYTRNGACEPARGVSAPRGWPSGLASCRQAGVTWIALSFARNTLAVPTAGERPRLISTVLYIYTTDDCRFLYSRALQCNRLFLLLRRTYRFYLIYMGEALSIFKGGFETFFCSFWGRSDTEIRLWPVICLNWWWFSTIFIASLS